MPVTVMLAGNSKVASEGLLLVVSPQLAQVFSPNSVLVPALGFMILGL